MFFGVILAISPINTNLDTNKFSNINISFMFGQLRINNPLFILNKQGSPSLEVGTVVSVTAPMPQLSSVGQLTMYTVDVTARVNDQNVTYQKLPANTDVADFAGNGNVVIACSRESMNSELQAMRQRSVDVVKSVDYHNGLIQAIDKIIQDLNPEEAEKLALQKEVTDLKGQMLQMSQSVNALLEQNRQLMEQIKSERNNTKKQNKE